MAIVISIVNPRIAWLEAVSHDALEQSDKIVGYLNGWLLECKCTWMTWTLLRHWEVLNWQGEDHLISIRSEAIKDLSRALGFRRGWSDVDTANK